MRRLVFVVVLLLAGLSPVALSTSGQAGGTDQAVSGASCADHQLQSVGGGNGRPVIVVHGMSGSPKIFTAGELGGETLARRPDQWGGRGACLELRLPTRGLGLGDQPRHRAVVGQVHRVPGSCQRQTGHRRRPLDGRVGHPVGGVRERPRRRDGGRRRRCSHHDRNTVRGVRDPQRRPRAPQYRPSRRRSHQQLRAGGCRRGIALRVGRYRPDRRRPRSDEPVQHLVGGQEPGRHCARVQLAPDRGAAGVAGRPPRLQHGRQHHPRDPLRPDQAHLLPHRRSAGDQGFGHRARHRGEPRHRRLHRDRLGNRQEPER